MTSSYAVNRSFTTGRSIQIPAPGSQIARNLVPDLFDAAEFSDRFACGEDRGNLADVVDGLVTEQGLAVALLFAESVEARRIQQKAADVMKRRQGEQQIAPPAAT
jgi:hypothetical protein